MSKKDKEFIPFSPLFRGFHKCDIEKNEFENVVGDTTITINGEKITGRWVIGNGIHYPKSINYAGTCWIDGMSEKANDWIEVIPETVSLFSQLTDSDNKQIFPFDILEVEVTTIKDTGDYGLPRASKQKTYWSVEQKTKGYYALPPGVYAFGLDRRFKKQLTHSIIYNTKAKVVGNVFENPELLKGKFTVEEDEETDDSSLVDSLLQKEIPKKPIAKDLFELGTLAGFGCPNCSNTLSTRGPRCEECGQVIDWDKK